MEFDDNPDGDYVVLTYGQDINDKNKEEVGEALVEALVKYIGTHILAPGNYSIPVLTKVRGMNRDHSGNLIGEPNKKQIPGNRI